MKRRLSEPCTCDTIEQAVAELRRNERRIRELLPAKVIIHLPPEDSGRKVSVEIHGKLR
jgi:hypothetical protein